MLDTLGEELLGRVLATLPAADLQVARQASRILDRASRAHTDRAATLTLRSITAGRRAGGPDWARFPRLRRLVLRFWGAADCEALRGLFPVDAGALLGGLEELDASAHSCRAGRTHVGRNPAPHAGPGHAAPAILFQEGGARAVFWAAVGALAPRLACLEAFYWRLDIDTAGLVARLLPALRTLSIDGLEGSSAGGGSGINIFGRVARFAVLQADGSVIRRLPGNPRACFGRGCPGPRCAFSEWRPAAGFRCWGPGPRPAQPAAAGRPTNRRLAACGAAIRLCHIGQV